jgi:hypothetical protein
MIYFTPELYMQFNSLDPEEAESADTAWDQAETAYITLASKMLTDPVRQRTGHRDAGSNS